MKRKIVIIVSIILVLIMLTLYYTYAINVTMEETTGEADLTYNINLTDPQSTSISVGAGKSKIFDIFITNNNGGTINYGLAYNPTKPEGVTIAQVDTSKDKVSDLIEDNTTNQISLIIINNTESDVTYNIVPMVGYEKGGDLIVEDGYTLISDVYSFPIEPNSPDLVEGLVPITYSNNKWVKADSSNKNNSWYNYSDKKWANAVLVTSSYRDSNNNDTFSVGDEVPEDAILAYYVWIPRYKYKVWNINKVIGTDSYSAQNTGIDIKWESGKKTTGTINCNYEFSVTDGSLSEICSGSNEDYYTHPAFTFGDDKLRGIWVGKFEISSSSPSVSYGGGTSTTLAVRSKPNVNSWRYNYLTNFSYVIQNMGITDNEYGLKTDSNSHMLKNMEWGAVAYLTNSDYGRCSNSSCEELTVNDNSSYYTGGNDYVSNVGQSTTGNIYGIYDMSGGAYEYVMGNMSNSVGSYTYYASDGGSNFTYSTNTSKYIDTYATGGSYDDQIAYNRARLGDATGEVVASNGYAWNGDYAYFVISTWGNPWFGRGGDCSYGSIAGVFLFLSNYGDSVEGCSSRATLISLN